MAGLLFTSVGWGNLGLNLGPNPGLDESEVMDRRLKLKESLALRELIFMKQTHSARVQRVDSHSKNVDADAIFTSEKSVGLVALAADCLPILIRSEGLVAAIHAGRVGVSNSIISHTISAMSNAGGKNFEAIIGPSICVDCYEVSPEMYESYVADFPHAATTQTQHCLDLQSAAASELLSAGVEVHNLGICTREYSEFYSHRRSTQEGGHEGRQAGVIFL
jgi:hypothetical protein